MGAGETTRRGETTYPCPSCGRGVLAITAATDGLMRGLYCRRCKTRQTVTLSGGQPAPPVPPPRDVPTRATPQRPPVTPPIETVGIRDRRG